MNGTRPMSHVSGCRQRRNTNHHAAPTIATTNPHRIDGRTLLA